MGKKTSFTLKILIASLFTMLIVSFLFTDSIGLVSFGDEGETVAVDEVEDGTYIGTADGHNAPLEVEVTVENGEIADVVVLSHEESDGIADPALEEIPTAIVDNNSAEVDIVSGATITSDAIMAAVNDALAGTPGEPSDAATEEPADDEEDVEVSDNVYEDGSYEVTVDAHNGPLTVEVVVEEGTISSVEVLEHEETEGLADPAIEDVPAAIVASNSTEVDTVSGATVTSDAIISAVDEALGGEDSGPQVEGVAYTDGTYETTVDGAQGPLSVEVTITDGDISDVVILEHEETEDLADPALEDVPATIIESNSTDVDTVSGATVTSEAITEAVDTALLEAAIAYQVTVEGHNGPMTVEVTLEEDTITNVEVTEHEETDDLADPALEDVPASIVENNSTDVDSVSGATVTSEAVIEAVDLILEAVN